MPSGGSADASRNGIPVENPATGETIATVPELGAKEVRELVATARTAQPAWAESGFEARAKVLLDARRWMVANAERVVGTIVAETGRPVVGSGMRAPDWTRGDDLEAFVEALNGLEIVPREYVTFSAHQMGTCRMGRDPQTSVANPWGQLHDTPGVWIGDASAFPSASGTNPMATIMALARRTAHAIAAA